MGRKLKKGGDYRPAVAVKREAKDRFVQWCEDNDEELNKALSRLMISFLEAPPLVQAVFQRRPLPMVAHAYADALRALADDLASQGTAKSGYPAKKMFSPPKPSPGQSQPPAGRKSHEN